MLALGKNACLYDGVVMTLGGSVFVTGGKHAQVKDDWSAAPGCLGMHILELDLTQ